MHKIANCLVVGGPIAVGKTALLEALPFQVVPELVKNDELQEILLAGLYRGDKLAAEVFQFDMLFKRFEKYQELANQTSTHAFDRSILEDLLFAKTLLKSPSDLQYYQALWTNCWDTIAMKVGLPKLYILLTCSWRTFKKRLFVRDRYVEVSNYRSNRRYFKKLHKNYRPHMLSSFADYGISYVEIKTDRLSVKQISDLVLEEMTKRGIKWN
ncbi:deoxynucleoside kinase [Mycoplasma sp. ATU-Cv-508]|uniref:deoxynucleoside kinase n=1 Tax=Mycoplasma sp. ATU-Cv-508 TaxID=2048001 RepID=UPI000FDEA6DC